MDLQQNCSTTGFKVSRGFDVETTDSSENWVITDSERLPPRLPNLSMQI